MGTLTVYLISICFYISVCVASASEHGKQNAQKDNPIDKEPLKLEEPEDDDDSGAADDVPPRNRRVLQSSDILTPPELLPLAKRLIAKVDTVKPGEGKGIVSSARSAETLADSLFHRFFMTDRRIARLRKLDIAGLDALQALALDGAGIHKNLKLVSVDGGRCYVDEFAKHGAVHNSMCYPNQPGHRKSIYNLLSKPIKPDLMKENDRINRRQRQSGVPQSRIKLMSKLQKKRQIVVNAGRKHNEHQNKKAESMIRGETKGPNNEKDNGQLNVATSKPHDTVSKKAHLKGCRWRFECLTPRNLDTCRLKTSCPGNEEDTDKNLEQEKLQQQFRKMIGISSVDEEVEKILEVRALSLRRMMSFKQEAAIKKRDEPSKYKNMA
ncbi:uncharacterized protein LOC133517856 isoform X2 [Cydia pomonella]|uniref:uncharacterized protein LOC133517856 isoform X2 n=1 Tax=Cydia pomonella TaxID=82600 RepID=UPI002ADE51A5|nr:uncharacterized protein LOC133517856 isoform X2 [Cydia pomonella]